MKMYNQKKSLYLILSPIIILTVILVISINSTISYITTKNQIINDIKNDSNRMIVELRNNIKNLMDSYSVNEYEKLLHNEMESNEILFAIVVKDYKIQQSKFQNDKDNGRCLYLHIELNGEDRVLWGNYKFLIEQISQIKKEDMPFKARIVNEHGYMFK